MNKENCVLNLVDKIILWRNYYSLFAVCRKHRTKCMMSWTSREAHEQIHLLPFIRYILLGFNIAKNWYFPASFSEIIPYRYKKNILFAGLDADNTSQMTSTSGVKVFSLFKESVAQQKYHLRAFLLKVVSETSVHCTVLLPVVVLLF